MRRSNDLLLRQQPVTRFPTDTPIIQSAHSKGIHPHPLQGGSGADTFSECTLECTLVPAGIGERQQRMRVVRRC